MVDSRQWTTAKESGCSSYEEFDHGDGLDYGGDADNQNLDAADSAAADDEWLEAYSGMQDARYCSSPHSIALSLDATESDAPAVDGEEGREPEWWRVFGTQAPPAWTPPPTARGYVCNIKFPSVESTSLYLQILASARHTLKAEMSLISSVTVRMLVCMTRYATILMRVCSVPLDSSATQSPC